jgi:hypothetical protein
VQIPTETKMPRCQMVQSGALKIDSDGFS